MADKKKYTAAELQEWLIDKALSSSPSVARKLILYNDQRGRDSPIVGRLYLFKYDPQWKQKLLQYDRVPLVFPIEQYGNGFLGLNIHYLSMGERSALIEELLQFRNNTKMDESTKLLISYQLLQSISSAASLARPCVKRYLFRQVRSKFIEILPSEYDRAIQLPVEDWVFKT
jgi:hypothetical protein